MADLIAREEAAKAGAAAPKKVGKGKGKGKSSEAGGAGPSAPPPPPLPPPPPSPPPVSADGEPALTKAQIKRRKVKAAAAARKTAAAFGPAAGEEEEEGSDASSCDAEPPRSRPPIDFSKDSEFRRRLKLPLRDVEAEIDAIIAQHEALFFQRREALPAVVGAAPTAPRLVLAASDAARALAPPRDGY